MTGRDKPISATALSRIGPAIDAGHVHAANLCDDGMPPTLRDDCFRHGAHSRGYCDYRSMNVNNDIAQYAHDKLCEIRDKQWMATAFSPEWFTEQFARTGKGQADLFHFLSSRVGLDRSQVNKAISGKRKVQPSEMPLVWEFFGLPPEGLAFAIGAKPTADHHAAPPAANATRPEFQAFAHGPRIPVYGHAAAGNNGRFIMNGQRVADTFCPPDLMGVDGAYAVYVHGNSMEPKFEAGETVWINPHQPVRQGDYVVAQILEGDEDDGSPPSAYVKRYVSRGKDLVLYQFNPPEGETNEMRFPERRVISVHRIVFASI